MPEHTLTSAIQISYSIKTYLDWRQALSNRLHGLYPYRYEIFVHKSPQVCMLLRCNIHVCVAHYSAYSSYCGFSSETETAEND